MKNKTTCQDVISLSEMEEFFSCIKQRFGQIEGESFQLLCDFYWCVIRDQGNPFGMGATVGTASLYDDVQSLRKFSSSEEEPLHFTAINLNALCSLIRYVSQTMSQPQEWSLNVSKAVLTVSKSEICEYLSLVFQKLCFFLDETIPLSNCYYYIDNKDWLCFDNDMAPHPVLHSLCEEVGELRISYSTHKRLWHDDIERVVLILDYLSSVISYGVPV